MASLLYRLGKTAYRRWPLVLVAWLVALIGVGAVATTMSQPMSDQFSIPGIPSEKATDLQQQLFPGSGSAIDEASVSIVVAAPEGSKLAGEPYAGRISALLTELKSAPQMPREPLAGPVETAAAMKQRIVAASGDAAAAEKNAAAVLPLSPDGRVGIIEFAFDVATPTDVEPGTRDKVLEAIEHARGDGMQVEVSGSGMEGGGPGDEGGVSVELIGVGVALIVLAFTFGSLVAAGLPILTAGIGVALGVTGITAMTAFAELDSSTPLLATMIGLGVGIDYALFILARYRNELEHTDDRVEAIGVAVGTAGSAVVFAGLTVVIALAALSLTGVPFLAAMGWGAAATVVIAVMVALTLLPAVLGILKSRAFAGRFRRYTPSRDDSGKINNAGVRWARLIGRAPAVFALLVVVVLGAIAIPSSRLHLAFPSDSTAPTDTTRRKAADLINGAFGEGRLAPMLTVVDGRGVPEQERPAAYQEVVAWAAGHAEVANAQLGGMNEQGTGALILITPKHGPNDTATEALLDDLRDTQTDIEKQTGTSIGITGLTAIQTDTSQRLADALPLYLGVVIGLAFLILMVVFRSILVPLTATLGFLLSVGATLGATVLFFQEGVFGLFPGQPIISFIPIFLIGLVFGLAMDYQVFLVTRIREAHIHGASYREAVVDGFRNSARVVTAAALIMTAVFSGFMFMGEPIIQSMGFALSAAVLFDAFVVRMCLIPALMYLMGERAWWLPKWLDRILPNIDVEGESLDRPHLADQYRPTDSVTEPVRV
ncbi:multidrug RND transporter [Actinoplanes lobatus]|uniref:Multidrug RND transporter n=1 Tax=Actinoplanes lobatus TaxID=113568 RepID=A0A7W7HJL0_9ACTN|nr:MMPL family transporter [Actinoplanes lobatus]MBB4751689.1 RND superfamily putative drug exporter [Actinoplanes lobatus]GGN65289.1 multidrug RND transporter [Actinoplanes lobatus]GIE43272.1 multidrug RND transporter [Actinoplanes lobatus]